MAQHDSYNYNEYQYGTEQMTSEAIQPPFNGSAFFSEDNLVPLLNSSSGAYQFMPSQGFDSHGSQPNAQLAHHLIAANMSMAESVQTTGQPLNLDTAPGSLKKPETYDFIPTRQSKKKSKSSTRVGSQKRYERLLAGTRFAVESKQSKRRSSNSSSATQNKRRASTAMQNVRARMGSISSIPVKQAKVKTTRRPQTQQSQNQKVADIQEEYDLQAGTSKNGPSHYTFTMAPSQASNKYDQMDKNGYDIGQMTLQRQQVPSFTATDEPTQIQSLKETLEHDHLGLGQQVYQKARATGKFYDSKEDRRRAEQWHQVKMRPNIEQMPPSHERRQSNPFNQGNVMPQAVQHNFSTLQHPVEPNIFVRSKPLVASTHNLDTQPQMFVNQGFQDELNHDRVEGYSNSVLIPHQAMVSEDYAGFTDEQRATFDQKRNSETFIKSEALIKTNGSRMKSVKDMISQSSGIQSSSQMQYGKKLQSLAKYYNVELAVDSQHPQMFDERDRQSMITSQTGAQHYSQEGSPFKQQNYIGERSLEVHNDLLPQYNSGEFQPPIHHIKQTRGDQKAHYGTFMSNISSVQNAIQREHKLGLRNKTTQNIRVRKVSRSSSKPRALKKKVSKSQNQTQASQSSFMTAITMKTQPKNRVQRLDRSKKSRRQRSSVSNLSNKSKTKGSSIASRLKQSKQISSQVSQRSVKRKASKSPARESQRKLKKRRSQTVQLKRHALKMADIHYRDSLMRKHFCSWIERFIDRLKFKMAQKNAAASARVFAVKPISPIGEVHETLSMENTNGPQIRSSRVEAQKMEIVKRNGGRNLTEMDLGGDHSKSSVPTSQFFENVASPKSQAPVGANFRHHGIRQKSSNNEAYFSQKEEDATQNSGNHMAFEHNALSAEELQAHHYFGNVVEAKPKEVISELDDSDKRERKTEFRETAQLGVRNEDLELPLNLDLEEDMSVLSHQSQLTSKQVIRKKKKIRGLNALKRHANRAFGQNIIYDSFDGNDKMASKLSFHSGNSRGLNASVPAANLKNVSRISTIMNNQSHIVPQTSMTISDMNYDQVCDRKRSLSWKKSPASRAERPSHMYKHSFATRSPLKATPASTKKRQLSRSKKKKNRQSLLSQTQDDPRLQRSITSVGGKTPKVQHKSLSPYRKQIAKDASSKSIVVRPSKSPLAKSTLTRHSSVSEQMEAQSMIYASRIAENTWKLKVLKSLFRNSVNATRIRTLESILKQRSVRARRVYFFKQWYLLFQSRLSTQDRISQWHAKREHLMKQRLFGLWAGHTYQQRIIQDRFRSNFWAVAAIQSYSERFCLVKANKAERTRKLQDFIIKCRLFQCMIPEGSKVPRQQLNFFRQRQTIKFKSRCFVGWRAMFRRDRRLNTFYKVVKAKHIFMKKHKFLTAWLTNFLDSLKYKRREEMASQQLSFKLMDKALLALATYRRTRLLKRSASSVKYLSCSALHRQTLFKQWLKLTKKVQILEQKAAVVERQKNDSLLFESLQLWQENHRLARKARVKREVSIQQWALSVWWKGIQVKQYRARMNELAAEFRETWQQRLFMLFLKEAVLQSKAKKRLKEEMGVRVCFFRKHITFKAMVKRIKDKKKMNIIKQMVADRYNEKLLHKAVTAFAYNVTLEQKVKEYGIKKQQDFKVRAFKEFKRFVQKSICLREALTFMVEKRARARVGKSLSIWYSSAKFKQTTRAVNNQKIRNFRLWRAIKMFQLNKNLRLNIYRYQRMNDDMSRKFFLSKAFIVLKAMYNSPKAVAHRNATKFRFRRLALPAINGLKRMYMTRKQGEYLLQKRTDNIIYHVLKTWRMKLAAKTGYKRAVAFSAKKLMKKGFRVILDQVRVKRDMQLQERRAVLIHYQRIMQRVWDTFSILKKLKVGWNEEKELIMEKVNRHILKKWLAKLKLSCKKSAQTQQIGDWLTVRHERKIKKNVLVQIKFGIRKIMKINEHKHSRALLVKGKFFSLLKKGAIHSAKLKRIEFYYNLEKNQRLYRVAFNSLRTHAKSQRISATMNKVALRHLGQNLCSKAFNCLASYTDKQRTLALLHDHLVEVTHENFKKRYSRAMFDAFLQPKLDYVADQLKCKFALRRLGKRTLRQPMSEKEQAAYQQLGMMLFRKTFTGFKVNVQCTRLKRQEWKMIFEMRRRKFFKLWKKAFMTKARGNYYVQGLPPKYKQQQSLQQSNSFNRFKRSNSRDNDMHLQSNHYVRQIHDMNIQQEPQIYTLGPDYLKGANVFPAVQQDFASEPAELSQQHYHQGTSINEESESADHGRDFKSRITKEAHDSWGGLPILPRSGQETLSVNLDCQGESSLQNTDNMVIHNAGPETGRY